MSLRATSYEGFDGAGGSSPRMEPRQLITWLLEGALVPHHVGLSTRLVECPPDLVAGFPQVSDPSDSKAEMQCLYDPALEVTCSHFSSYWLHRSILFSVRRDYTGPWIPVRKNHQGSSWKLAATGLLFHASLDYQDGGEKKRSPHSKHKVLYEMQIHCSA